MSAATSCREAFDRFLDTYTRVEEALYKIASAADVASDVVGAISEFSDGFDSQDGAFQQEASGIMEDLGNAFTDSSGFSQGFNSRLAHLMQGRNLTDLSIFLKGAVYVDAFSAGLLEQLDRLNFVVELADGIAGAVASYGADLNQSFPAGARAEFEARNEALTSDAPEKLEALCTMADSLLEGHDDTSRVGGVGGPTMDEFLDQIETIRQDLDGSEDVVDATQIQQDIASEFETLARELGSLQTGIESATGFDAAAQAAIPDLVARTQRLLVQGVKKTCASTEAQIAAVRDKDGVHKAQVAQKAHVRFTIYRRLLQRSSADVLAQYNAHPMRQPDPLTGISPMDQVTQDLAVIDLAPLASMVQNAAAFAEQIRQGLVTAISTYVEIMEQIQSAIAAVQGTANAIRSAVEAFTEAYEGAATALQASARTFDTIVDMAADLNTDRLRLLLANGEFDAYFGSVLPILSEVEGVAQCIQDFEATIVDIGKLEPLRKLSRAINDIRDQAAARSRLVIEESSEGFRAERVRLEIGRHLRANFDTAFEGL